MRPIGRTIDIDISPNGKKETITVFYPDGSTTVEIKEDKNFKIPTLRGNKNKLT